MAAQVRESGMRTRRQREHSERVPLKTPPKAGVEQPAVKIKIEILDICFTCRLGIHCAKVNERINIIFFFCTPFLFSVCVCVCGLKQT